MQLGIQKTKKFKKYGFLVGFLVSFAFMKQFKKKIPATLSFYILARIGILYINKLKAKNIINKDFPVMKVIFMVLLAFLNYYIVNYPNFISKKIVNNYK